MAGRLRRPGTDATSLRCLALKLIPGLLQTKDYAHEVHLLAEHMTAPDEVGRGSPRACSGNTG